MQYNFLKLMIIVIIFILTIIFLLILKLKYNQNKNYKFLFSGGIILMSIIIINIIVFFLGKSMKRIEENILQSTYVSDWPNCPECQLDTIKKCQSYMKRKHKKLVNNIYDDERINELKEKLYSNDKKIRKQTKDHIYQTALVCLNSARLKKK